MILKHLIRQDSEELPVKKKKGRSQEPEGGSDWSNLGLVKSEHQNNKVKYEL